MTYKQQARIAIGSVTAGLVVLGAVLVTTHHTQPLRATVHQEGSIQTVTTPDNYVPPKPATPVSPQAQPTTANSTTDALQTSSGTNVAQPAAPAPTPVTPVEQPHLSPQATVPPNSTTAETTITFGGGDQ